MNSSSPRVRALALTLLSLLLGGCYINDISYGPTIRRLPSVPGLEEQVARHIAELEGETGLKLRMPYRVEVVRATSIDEEGKPQCISPAGYRASGWTEFERPLVLTFPKAEGRSILPNVIRHECLHAILLSNKIVGHPEEYAHLAWRWTERHARPEPEEG